MGRYFYRDADISDANISRGLTLIQRDLDAMRSELTTMKAAIARRQAERERNFKASGGETAFPRHEIDAAKIEDTRLQRLRMRLESVAIKLAFRA